MCVCVYLPHAFLSFILRRCFSVSNKSGSSCFCGSEAPRLEGEGAWRDLSIKGLSAWQLQGAMQWCLVHSGQLLGGPIGWPDLSTWSPAAINVLCSKADLSVPRIHWTTAGLISACVKSLSSMTMCTAGQRVLSKCSALHKTSRSLHESRQGRKGEPWITDTEFFITGWNGVAELESELVLMY